MLDISGYFVPIVTPFTDDASGLSEVRLARYLRRLLESDIGGIVVTSDVGEFISTSFSERKTVLEWVLRDTRAQIPVIAHVTTLNTGASLDLAQHAERHGARAAMLAPPYYGDFTPEEYVHHFRTVAQYCKIPILVVDPLGRLCPDALREVESLGTVCVAHRSEHHYFSDHPSSYEWAYGNAIANPLAGFLKSIAGAHEHSICSYLKDLGVVRSMKYLLGEMGIEVGGNWSPYLDLTQPQREVVRLIAQMIREKEETAGHHPAA